MDPVKEVFQVGGYIRSTFKKLENVNASADRLFVMSSDSKGFPICLGWSVLVEK